MARRPLQICNHAGCNAFVRASRCERHARERGKGTSKNRPGDPFYSSKAWRQVRHRALTRDRWLCLDCLENGRSVVAEEVDHVIPRRTAPARELDLTNLRSLCKSCHSKKTASTRHG